MYNTCHLNMYVHLHAYVFRFSRLLYSQFSLYIYIIIFYISKFNVFISLRLGFRLVIEWRAVKVITIDNDFCIVLRCGRCKCFPVFLYIFFIFLYIFYINILEFLFLQNSMLKARWQKDCLLIMFAFDECNSCYCKYSTAVSV